MELKQFYILPMKLGESPLIVPYGIETGYKGKIGILKSDTFNCTLWN